mmetsp:Transcript_23675/g.65663  ORF Transcript_23675/g.65663 Transcript_23675/m.65663 type:complete len:148 (-) Transcript_23675:307-750(-)|eukprot:CAMPEP_0117665878 /NCGR_PEP_ID=MMETSP0804-20121206/10059_1 /TAXON_ID=1074897 /ORGANISM="Tetraselmis astigmatica, Strain CCMP880" /LENGTH=147 /DNA_ID=CAMNT_0005473349 /DNA_START=86 /DNA_END=529 /DNA_ORIENTATION=+
MQLNLEAEPEARFQLCCVVVLVLSLVTSVAEPDVSGSLAVLGLVAVAISNQQLMRMLTWVLPASVLVDIIRLAMHRPSGFIIFLDVVEMVAKTGGTYYAYVLWRQSSSMIDMGYSPNQPLGTNSSPSPGNYAPPTNPPAATASYPGV